MAHQSGEKPVESSVPADEEDSAPPQETAMNSLRPPRPDKLQRRKRIVRRPGRRSR